MNDRFGHFLYSPQGKPPLCCFYDRALFAQHDFFQTSSVFKRNIPPSNLSFNHQRVPGHIFFRCIKIATQLSHLRL